MAEDFSADGMLDMYLYENGQLLEQLEASRDAAEFEAAKAADDGGRVSLDELRAEVS